ncbi:MAG: alpha-amylase [Chloroflexi bacterium]|nr:alpha-amylase [Chloroflexota bacterium]
MQTIIEIDYPTSLAQINLSPRGNVHSSPVDWRDQSFYFLLPDRFSDGEEGKRPLYTPTSPSPHQTKDKAAWMAAGKQFQGGTLNGIRSKLDYLQNLGVTTLWIGPIWRQRADLETYHGYGIQNFLDVDPRFGTRQDLRDLVDAAHERGMYILLDIIYNHTGNNWFYEDHEGNPQDQRPYRYSPPHPFHCWRGKNGEPISQISSPDDGVWPVEFQNVHWYTRAGSIGKWDVDTWENPIHPETEFRRGDFFELKDLNLAHPDVLSAMIQVYQYWMALSDCDGFRIDTVKHISWEASRTFCGALHEFAESIGKNNFLLLGEVTGGAAMAHDYLEIFGRNIDAVLDIGEPTRRLANLVSGKWAADTFFSQFGSHNLLGGHRETGRFHVTILDDHDMVGRDKFRFAAQVDKAHREIHTAHAVGTMLLTLGMPCIYYGTEQAFDGGINYHDASLDPDLRYEDRYVREAMFGATFGAFGTEDCHFFDQSHPTYLRIAAISQIRNRRDLVGLCCRRGRQYLREVSRDGFFFSYPRMGGVAAWSRILTEQEVVVAVNTNERVVETAVITIDAKLNRQKSHLTYLYRSDWSDAQLENPPTDQTQAVRLVNGRATVTVTLPPAGMAILA